MKASNSVQKLTWNVIISIPPRRKANCLPTVGASMGDDEDEWK